MKVVFCIYSEFRLNLYSTLADVYERSGYEVIIICQDRKTYKAFSTRGFQVISLSISRANTTINFDSSIDTVTGVYSNEVANDLHHSYIETLKSLSLCDEDLIFAGNGYHIQDYAVKEVANKRKVKTIFSELSNVPGLTFFDRKGSNIRSRLLEISDHYKMVDFDGSALAEFTTKIRNREPVPQSKKDNKSVIISLLEDVIFGFPSHNVLRIKSNSLIRLVSFAFSRLKRNKIEVDFSKEIPNKYLFYPFQVTSDSQLLLNSNVGNYDALEYYLNKAEDKGLNLVVKLHPAEHDSKKINEYIEFCQTRSIYIADGSTFDLIKGAVEVGVVNSTVGLESIILGKKTSFLATSFYQKLQNPDFCKFYFEEYLVEMDFFSGKTVLSNEALIEKINFLAKC